MPVKTVAAMIAVTLLTGCGADSITNPATSASGPPCRLGNLWIRLQSEGESGSTILTVSLVNRGRITCVASSQVSIAIRQGQRNAVVDGNPLVGVFRLPVSPGQTRIAYAAHWSNWCHSRRSLFFVVHAGRLSARSRFNYIPRCDRQKVPSKLIPMTLPV